MPKSKVENKEYDGGTVIAQGEPEAKEASGSPSSWKVGEVVPKTLFVDLDGKVSDKEPERGKVLVAEGDVVTDAVVRAIADNE